MVYSAKDFLIGFGGMMFALNTIGSYFLGGFLNVNILMEIMSDLYTKEQVYKGKGVGAKKDEIAHVGSDDELKGRKVRKMMRPDNGDFSLQKFRNPEILKEGGSAYLTVKSVSENGSL